MTERRFWTAGAFPVRSASWALLLLVGLLSGCGGRRSEVAVTARYVTVGSSVTETVFALGGGANVVGVDASSLFPEATAALPKVGYQRTLTSEGILSLRPTLVLASAEAGPPAALEHVKGASVPLELVAAEPDLGGARERIRKVAALIGKDPGPLLARLDRELAEVKSRVDRAPTRPRVMVVYARGGQGMHVFGRKTVASLMVELAGGAPAVTGYEGSRPLTSESVVEAAPDLIVVPARGLESVGGVEGMLRAPGIASTPAGKQRRIVPMDDLLLLGMGPRTGQAAAELFGHVHPEVQ